MYNPTEPLSRFLNSSEQAKHFKLEMTSSSMFLVLFSRFNKISNICYLPSYLIYNNTALNESMNPANPPPSILSSRDSSHERSLEFLAIEV